MSAITPDEARNALIDALMRWNIDPQWALPSLNVRAALVALDEATDGGLQIALQRRIRERLNAGTSS